MTIAKLRREIPGWTWRAERAGMGWVYRGTRAGREVRVYAVAVLCGPTEDDFATDWRVDDGDQSVGYSAWWIQNAPLTA